MHKQNDIELVAQSLRGNEAAYAELVNRYKNALYRHCFAIVKDEDAAEDIAQDTFVTAYYKLSSYDPKFKLGTWLFKIGTNKALTYLKKHSRQWPLSAGMQDRVVSTLPGPEREMYYVELEEGVDRLKPKYRVVTRLHYWEGLKYYQIAELLNVSEGTVKSWLHRAKKQLRKELS